MPTSSNQGHAADTEYLEKLANGIKPSWELDNAPFSMGNRVLTAAEWAVLHGTSGPNADLQNALIDDAQELLPGDLVSEPIGVTTTQSGIGAGIKPYVSSAQPQTAPHPASFPPPAPPFTAVVAGGVAAVANAPAPAARAQPQPQAVSPAMTAARVVAQQPRSVPPPAYSSPSLSDTYPAQKSRKGLWVGVGVVVIAAAGFGIHTATSSNDTSTPAGTTSTTGTSTPPTTAATSTATAAATNPRTERDIPPPSAATDVSATHTATATAIPTPTSAAAARATNATTAATTSPPPHAAVTPPPPVRPPTTKPTPAAKPPRTPPAPPTTKPAAKPPAGGIVRDVPF